MLENLRLEHFFRDLGSCPLNSKLLLEGLHYGSLVSQFGHPVVFVEQGFELVHRHAELRRHLEQVVQMGHESRVLLTLFLLRFRLSQPVVERLHFVTLVLDEREEVVWNRGRVVP